MRRACKLASFIALAGCSLVNDPGAHQGGDTGPPPIPAEQFCRALAELQCDAYYTCCDAAPDPTADTLEACIQMVNDGCTSGEIGILIRDRRTGFDPVVAAEVIAEGRAIANSCSTDILAWTWERSGFQRALAGTVAGGGRCTPESVMFESFDYPALFSCRGTELSCAPSGGSEWSCLARSREGERCVVYWDCEDGLRCERVLGVPTACRRRLPNGLPCEQAADCESLLCTRNFCRDAPQQAVYCGGT